MNNEPRAMKEIHDIRLEIYEETKNMSSEELIAYTRKAVEDIEKERGIKFLRLEDSIVNK